jgi:hypothetical protein
MPLAGCPSSLLTSRVDLLVQSHRLGRRTLEGGGGGGAVSPEDDVGQGPV